MNLNLTQSPSPTVLRYPEAISDLKPPIFSIDYEFSVRTSEPTILGVSDGDTTVSVPHAEGHPYLLELLEKYRDAKWLGHNFTGAENEIWRGLGINIAPERILDTIALHYLVNMNLCKSSAKVDDEEGGASRGRGWMNLYAMCSLYTDAPNWKACIGEEQCQAEHRSCPDHNPFQYNGEDCYWAIKAYPKLSQIAKLRGVDKLYPLHRDLLLTLQRVKERGVLVDVPYVEKLSQEFEGSRSEIRANFGFNPDSPKQVTAHFRAKGVDLESAQEQAVREACEDSDDPELHSLLEYKELGKGMERWFKKREFDYKTGYWEGYVDEAGYIHCNLGIFTSTGRFNCTGPNLQNVAKRRKDRRTGESLGKRVRRAIIAPDGHYLYRADYKNAENVVFLTLAGYRDLPETDFHAVMRDRIGITDSDPFAVALGGAREAAKSVTHATDYFEGLRLCTREEMRKPNFQREVAAGARLVFPDWTVFGKTVTFTGSNLARRAFGSATLENRKRALDVQIRYFNAFPKLRDLQKRITAQVERDRCVRPPTGYCMLSYGDEHDRLKTAASLWGQNPVAHFIKRAMIRAASGYKVANVLSIHDELLFYADKRFAPEAVKREIQDIMCFHLPEAPELSLRIDVSHGNNWADQTEIS